MKASMRHAVGAALLCLVGVFTVSSQRSDTALFWALFVAVGLGSALVMAVSVRVWRPDPAWPWWCMTGGLLSWAAAFFVDALLGPQAAAATAGYTLGYLCFAVALYRFAGSGARLGTDSLLESGVVLLVAVYGAVDLLAEPVWHAEGTSAADRVSATVFPVLDAVVLALLAQLLLSRRRPHPAVLLLAAGATATALADVLYAIDLQPAFAIPPRVMAFGWVVGYVLLALSALHPSMVRLVERAPREHEPSALRLAASGTAVLVLPLITVVAHALDGEMEALPLLPVAAAVAGLTIWRVVRLVGQEQQARRTADGARRYFQALAEKASDLYAVIDDQATVKDISPVVAAMLGFHAQEIVGRVGLDFVDEEDVPAVHALVLRVASVASSSEELEFRACRADGSRLWVELRLTNLLDDPAVRGLVANVQDVDARKRLELELTQQAFHDALTGLANRALLQDRLQHALARAAREGREVAVLFCDLDGFKTVNDSLGHGAGDELLRVVAARLLLSARASDTVARLGGDEFAVLVEGGGDVLAAAHEVADRILDALRDPVDLGGRLVTVAGSVGVARSGDGCVHRPSTCADELLRNADTAMYAAKSQGRNRWVDFDASMHHAVETRLVLEGDLRGAVERGELVVHYQPVVAVDAGVLTGFEALVRWQHPVLGLVPPMAFIPLAEESGQVLEIGRWVLQQACRAAARWSLPEGGRQLDVAVNVSARQLADDAVVDDVALALLDSGLPAGRLVLELTESILVAQPGEVRERLQRLRALGVRIAIDDFGTGYSSLSYLRQFPVDILKIDRSFVTAIDETGAVPPIVRALFDLGRTLELQTVAEGIESPEQLSALVQQGCHLGQGFLFARPMDETAAAGLARAGTGPLIPSQRPGDDTLPAVSTA